uniref:TFIIS N-terminal domain-containing protein n=1 Tax=Anopheles farauti TaxID=69004 RepID=A0A182QU02_9DIPT
MPRIDPMKLLVCLSVLLAPNGGIRNAGEVRRLANLMAKFSKKLVSKCIYIQILKCTETELLGQFMQTGGWSLVHMWLVDGIASKNWPLIQELLELLLCCPVDVERLKINSTPRLVKSLSTDSAHESVRVLATKLVEQWLYIVKAPKQMSPMVPINQTELSADGKQLNIEGSDNIGNGGLLGKQTVGDLTNGMRHDQHNGYGAHIDNVEVTEAEQTDSTVATIADGGSRKTFQKSSEQEQQLQHQTVPYKKTSLVLKFTTQNGKQVVAKVVKPSKKSNRDPLVDHANAADQDEENEVDDDDEDDEEDDEDQEEVVVNIESGKSSETTMVNGIDAEQQKEEVDAGKQERENGVDVGAKERHSSSSKDQRHHHSHRDRENPSSTTIPSKKASISIEVRNPENRAKTVKTYNSQFRSHGLIEEAPPPPSRKGLKKPSSSSTTSSASPSTAIGSTAMGTVKRSSPMPPAGSPVEKKAKEDPSERPGSIKLIPAKRQHALVESDMFMDALSATLRKDVKKRKRRTSGSESTTTTTSSASAPAVGSKPGSESSSASKPDTTNTTKPGSPRNEESASDASSQPTTPTSPKIPTIAPMSFYRDTLAEQEDEENGSDSAKVADDSDKKELAEGEAKEGDEKKRTAADANGDETVAGLADNEDDDEAPIVKRPKRAKCELNDENDDEEEKGKDEDGDEDKTELLDAVMNDVEKKIAEEAVEGEGTDEDKREVDGDGKKPPGPGCGPDGPPGVLVIHRRKGPKKQLRWRAAEELEEVRYFELDHTERCNVTKSFTDMKQMERVDERQKFMLSRKVASEDIMVERTAWRPLLLVDNVPASPDGSQSLERNIQRQRERGCLQALYFNKHMIPDSPVEPDPADTYQTADPVHIPLEDVTGNPDSVNDFTSVPWPDPKSTPPHESAAFNSPFFPTDLPPGPVGFGPGGFPPPFAPGVAATIGPGPWNLGPPTGAVTGPPIRAGGVIPPGMFPINQPPPGMVGGPPPQGGPGGGGGSPNILNLPMNMPPNVPPPGMFPGAGNFNAPPPEFGGPMGGGRGSGSDFRNGPPPPQQWVTGNNRPFGGSGGGGGGFGNRGGGGGGGNWNNRNANGGNRNAGGPGGDRGRDDGNGRGNFRGNWVTGGSNRGHNNNNNGRGRKW